MTIVPAGMFFVFACGLMLALLAGCAGGGAPVYTEPPAENIWPGEAPGSQKSDADEEIDNRDKDQNAFGLNRMIHNVSIPTIAIHLPPKETATGTAVIISPGGAFRFVVIDKEGHDVARRLNSIGVAAIVLKYRTKPYAEPETSVLDLQRAIRIVRSRADELNIRPDRIGIMGFSAGGRMVSMAATQYDAGQADADDPVERVSSRPDFTAMIYPGAPKDIENRANKDTPPAFLVHAWDDPVPADSSVRYYQALRKVGVVAEMHIYAGGGHGFGLGVEGGPVTGWPELFSEWLTATGLSVRPDKNR